MDKKISLVLGSGGARGYAHIGAIEALEEAGYTITAVSGSSMGALIGGLYACGKLDEYRRWVTEFDAMGVLKLVDFSFGRSGIIRGDKVFDGIKAIVGEVRIEDLAIPFTAVATDIHAQKEVWFQKGDLLDAIRASIAVPSIFTPKVIDGRTYVDGGVMSPLPTIPLFSSSAEIMVAVDLNAPPSKSLQDEVKPDTIKEKAIAFIRDNFFSGKAEQLDSINILNASLEAMQNRITRYALAARMPEITVEIPGNICEFYDFHKAPEVIAYGKEAARKAIEQYESREG